MSSFLKIKKEYLERGITNTFLAEKAGITPAELFELDPGDNTTRKNLFNRIVQVLNSDEGGSFSTRSKIEKSALTMAEV